jgi:hypothetical protein
MRSCADDNPPEEFDIRVSEFTVPLTVEMSCHSGTETDSYVFLAFSAELLHMPEIENY